MDSNCTDSSNEEYQIYWFNYFVSIGYIQTSDVVNIYAPYGKCTTSLLWITYLINIIHFFFLSSGILYFLNVHRNQSGFWWPFLTWILSFILLAASIVSFVLLNLHVTLFSILIITCQLSTLIILWISIMVVVTLTFAIEHRYQRCLFFLIMLLLLMEICCFVAQVLITLHCLFNLKFISTLLDYAYWSAIIAGSGTIVSTLLLDHIFMWCRQRKETTRVHPIAIPSQNSSQNRATSPVDSVILNDFHRQPVESLFHVYRNSDHTRHFHIQPITYRSEDVQTLRSRLLNIVGKKKVHNLMTSSDA